MELFLVLESVAACINEGFVDDLHVTCRRDLRNNDLSGRVPEALLTNSALAFR